MHPYYIAQIPFYIATTLTLLPLIYGIKYYKQLNQSLKYIVLLMGVSFVSDTSAHVASHIIRNSLFIVNTYIVLNLILIAFAYRDFYSKQVQQLLGITVTSITFFSIYRFIAYDFFMIDIIVSGICDSISILIILGYFYYMLHKQEQKRIEDEPFFWISAGFLFHLLVGFAMFFGYNFFIEQNNEIMKIIIIKHLFDVGSIIRNIFVYLGLRHYIRLLSAESKK